MAEVITVVEMMKYENIEKAIFPVGTILTPSAKDWASEHNIEIIIGDSLGKRGNLRKEDNGGIEKAEFLKQVVAIVIKNIEKTGGALKKEDISEVVERSLQKLGFKVD